MSFSSDIKKELNKGASLSNKNLVKFELLGYLISGNSDFSRTKKEIKFLTESDYNINRLSKLLSNLDINHDIDVVGKNFVIKLKIKNLENLVEIENEKIYIKKEIINKNLKEEEKKAIIKGTFMGGGSINNPKNTYHLELIFNEIENLQLTQKMLLDFDISSKQIKLKNKYLIYIKDGEKISEFLALIGASRAVMEFEDIRIEKEMRGKVNRLVNCKTANLNKTINASVEQISEIKKLKESKKFNKLNDNLKEIANLRLENPNMSLIELGKLLKQPLGKSGVNYRLKKIVEIANDIK